MCRPYRCALESVSARHRGWCGSVLPEERIGSLFQCRRGGLRPEIGALCLRRRCRARPVLGGARTDGGVRCPRRARPCQEGDELGEGSEQSNFIGVGERGQAATRGERPARKGDTAAALTVSRRLGDARAGAGLSAPRRRVSARGSTPSLGLRPRPDLLEAGRGPFNATRPDRARGAAPGRHRYASPTRRVSGGSAVRVELRGSCASFPDALRQAEELGLGVPFTRPAEAPGSLGARCTRRRPGCPKPDWHFLPVLWGVLHIDPLSNSRQGRLRGFFFQQRAGSTGISRVRCAEEMAEPSGGPDKDGGDVL